MVRVGLALLLVAGTALAGDGPIEAADPDLDELSGLAVSRADAQVLWAHNDTGGGPLLYRLGPRGENLGSVFVDDVQSNDWEDIAAFEHRGAPALLIADVGNNLALRAPVTLYAVSDPGRTGEPKLLWRLTFRFPDGARDCEAVAVDPVNREILLVSKRDAPPRLYRLPLPDRTTGTVQQAEFLAELAQWPAPAGWLPARRFAGSPTAFDISRDGSRAVIVSPTRAYVYRRADGASWAQALQHPVTTLDLPAGALEQIEAAALSADGRELIVGSEGRPARLVRIALPQ